MAIPKKSRLILVLAASLFVPALFYGVQGNWTVIWESVRKHRPARRQEQNLLPPDTGGKRSPGGGPDPPGMSVESPDSRPTSRPSFKPSKIDRLERKHFSYLT